MSISEFKKKIKTERGWKHLDLERIDKARKVKPQEESWSCGPNSGYRALIINGDKSSGSDLDSFIKKCPKSLGSPQTTVGKVLNVSTGGIASAITAMGKLKKKVVGGSEFDVGPNPSSLAKYINQHSKSKVTRDRTDSWDDFWGKICSSIERGVPVIVLIEEGRLALHYINLIGYNANDKSVTMLDTNNAIVFWSNSEFKKKSTIEAAYIKGKYNVVKFS